LAAFLVSCGCLALGCAADPVPGDSDGWRSLFDGTTLTGWVVRSGTATYRVEDGAIVGRTTEGSGNTFLCTEEEFGDAELSLEVSFDDAGLNSGVQVRSQLRGDKLGGRVHGPQVELAAGTGKIGQLFGEGLGAWFSEGPKTKTPAAPVPVQTWTTVRVQMEGARIRTWIADQPVVDHTLDGEKAVTYGKGLIGLQVHGVHPGSGPWQVRWRNIRIRSLPVTATPAP
jgi:hypothetical protein